MMDKYIGRLLDNRYEILEMIGSGGMAVVYKARCHRLNRLVAIKILKDDYLEDEDFRRRFHAESQAVAMLSHPNIVSVYDVSTSISMEADYIVMELIEGITLKQYMEKKGVLNWKETLHFAMQIAKALDHAHGRGVVHRDIKPHNVMVLKNGSVKVADFGIARLMSKGDTLTKEALGSVHYISPEQAKGGRVDNRSDIYSLGVVMYEMMSGRPPYEGESPVSVAIQHINGGAILPSSLNPNIPAGMEQIIMKAMAHELKDRYATAADMLTDMDEFRKNPGIIFDYTTPPLNEVNKRPPLVLNPTPPKTTADKVEQRAQKQKTGTAAAGAVAKKPAENRGSHVATAAIIACSLVAIIAIAVFLVMLFNGGYGNNGKLVKVPDLVGKHFDALPTYDGLSVHQIASEYHNEFEEGCIISQKPEKFTMVQPGTEIIVTVSKGVDPQSIQMQNLVNLTEEKARSIINSQSLGLIIETQTEYSPTMAAGKVIRTFPEADEVLTAGQKVILVISLGEEPEDTTAEEKRMPQLKGQQIKIVMGILSELGFPDPIQELVYSDDAPGVVVFQSVAANSLVPITTVVTLQVSMGPDPSVTDPPTEPPTDPEPVTKTVNINVSEFFTGDLLTITVEVKRDGKTVFSGEIGSDNPLVVLENEQGNGVVSYEVYVGNELKRTEKVTFS